MRQALIIISAMTVVVSCTTIASPPPAKKIPHQVIICGDTLIDNYYWMRLSDFQKGAETPDTHTSEVLDFLNSENSYSHQVIYSQQRKLKKIYNDLKNRDLENDSTFPYYENGYYYYSTISEGQNYPQYFRQKNNQGELYLDLNKLAEGKKYCRITSLSISPDNRYLLYCADFVGRNKFSLYIKDLESGTVLGDSVQNTSYSAVWGADSKTIYYVGKDMTTLRADKVYRHRVGQANANDELIYFEEDPTYNISLSKSSDNKFILIHCDHTMNDEIRIIDAHDTQGKSIPFLTRRSSVKYSIDHNNGTFYILTNIDGAKDFKIMTSDRAGTHPSQWQDFIPETRGTIIKDFKIFDNYLVINEEHCANLDIKVINLKTKEICKPDFDAQCYSATIGENRDVKSDILRINFSSLTTPPSIYEYNMKTQTMNLVDRDDIPYYDINKYKEERIMAKASDGTLIPISLMSSKNFVRNGKGKVLLYGYGAYGSSSNPRFDKDILTLLDNGFVYAIAHVRGGSEMGYEWYEDGKMLNKRNSFTDFNDCARYLISQQYTSSHMYATGGSAGGLLVTAATNMEPDLYRGVIANVPFTDVINTMMDENIPLTTFEWEEWGDPREEPYYSYMKSYSPYDNIKAVDYPHMLVTSGYWDSQVQYWEPSKWVAKLREYKTDDNLLLFICDMDSGHGGASGRYERIMKKAKEYLFLIHLTK